MLTFNYSTHILETTSTIAIIIAWPESWYSFYHPTEDRRLSRAVTHPSTKRAQIQLTMLIEANTLSIRSMHKQWHYHDDVLFPPLYTLFCSPLVRHMREGAVAPESESGKAITFGQTLNFLGRSRLPKMEKKTKRNSFCPARWSVRSLGFFGKQLLGWASRAKQFCRLAWQFFGHCRNIFWAKMAQPPWKKLGHTRMPLVEPAQAVWSSLHWQCKS